jgi:hypothetical protein
MVFVDMADHGEIYSESISTAAQHVEAWLETLDVDARRPAVDQPEPLSLLAGVTQDQTVAMFGRQCLKDHQVGLQFRIGLQRLQSTQHIDQACALKVRFASEICGAAAEQLFDSPGLTY